MLRLAREGVVVDISVGFVRAVGVVRAGKQRAENESGEKEKAKEWQTVPCHPCVLVAQMTGAGQSHEEF